MEGNNPIIVVDNKPTNVKDDWYCVKRKGKIIFEGRKRDCDRLIENTRAACGISFDFSPLELERHEYEGENYVKGTNIKGI
jgi:hypothetical protein